MVRTAISFWFALPFVVMSAESHRVGVDVVKVLTGGQGEGEVIQHRIDAARRATGGTSAYTDAALTVALGAARKVFTAQIPEPVRVATLTENDEDVLVASFPVARRGVLHPVLLWNGAVWDTIIFECDASQILSPHSLQKLIEDMLTWSSPRLQGAKLSLRLPPPATGIVLSGFGQPSPLIKLQFAEPDVTFSGAIHGSYGYLSISILWVMRDHYGGPRIPERFPPLETRVGQWSTSRLMAEAGRYPPFNVDGRRDDIIIGELLRRNDFGPDQLEPVLRKIACLNEGAVLDGARAADRSEEFAAAIQAYFKKRRFACPM